jgi:hypothetical protein
MEFKVGEKINCKDGHRIEIMAIVKGYIMARYKGCSPFVTTKKELIEKIEARNT